MELGDKARDSITGFAGTLIGRAEYLTGCEQWLIVGLAFDPGKLGESGWFDADRIEVTEKAATKLDVTRAGGPQHDAPAHR